jgi:beta-lactamase regulating signal transducer with metallopeptidase domain/HEAT repeat protein
MRHFIDTFLEPALWFAADWSLRWAALLAVVALMLWIARPRRAAVRQLILLAALAAGLLVPFAPRWGDGWQWDQQQEPSPSPPPSVAPSFPGSAWERPDREALPRALPQQSATPREDPRQRQNARQSLASRAFPGGAWEREEREESFGRRQLIVLTLVSCWSFIVLCLLVRRPSGWFVLRRLRRESVEPTGPTADLFAACRAELGMRNKVRLAAHARVRSPVLFGFLRPMILLPSDWPQRAIETQRAGLLHELAHVRRRDHLLAPLLEIVRIAFFFHPLVRWLLARLEYERELLCDEMVIRHGIDPRDYARLLLEFARASGRLAWPAVSLPMSRRRTVKGRIDHLLEEDMERWIRPLPMRWTIVLGCGLLALTLALASYRVWAEEKEKPKNEPLSKEKAATVEDKKKPAEGLRREELRYAGKDFNQWRHDLLTELKGSVRVDGMRAFAAFGANGYAPEATQAILDIVRGYDTTNEDPKDDDGAVVHAAFRAIEKIGAEAVPALTAAVKNGNRNVRRFAIKLLGWLGTDARSALPAILQAMKDDDPETQLRAINAVYSIDLHAKDVVMALRDVLKGKNDTNRLHAIGALQQIGEDARPAIPGLIALLNDKSEQVRGGALSALRATGGGKEVVVPVSRFLRDKNHNMRQQAYGILQDMGADAKEAVPALIAVLKDPAEDIFTELTLNTLRSIGPGAKEAIPILNELLRENNNLPRKGIVDALKAINPDGNR